MANCDLFEAYFKMGRADLFLRRLDLWRSYLALGVTTLLEAPDDKGKNGQIESRSDCHAWGAHPIWFMQTGIAGIQSCAPCFAKVRIAPCPGELKKISARHPHPKGMIEVDLDFTLEATTGKIVTPVEGTYICPRSGRVTMLKKGVNMIRNF